MLKITSNAAAVADQVENIKKQIEYKLKAMVVSFANQVVSQAITYTPIGDETQYPALYQRRLEQYNLQPIRGFAKGSWRFSKTDSKAVQEFYTTAAGDYAKAEFATEMHSGYALGDSFYILNTGPYIRYVQGYVVAGGVVAATLKDIRSIYQYSFKQAFDSA